MLWLGITVEVQTFEELDSIKDKSSDVQLIRKLLEDQNDRKI
jgi:hypothetical protein